RQSRGRVRRRGGDRLGIGGNAGRCRGSGTGVRTRPRLPRAYPRRPRRGLRRGILARRTVSLAAEIRQEFFVSWLQKLTTPKIRTEGAPIRGKVPEGVWEKCSGCGIGLYRPELERNLMVCPKCGHHHPISARARLTAFLDEGGNELDAGMGPIDALKFKDSKKYRDRILAAQKATGEKDALVSIEGSVKGMPVG